MKKVVVMLFFFLLIEPFFAYASTLTLSPSSGTFTSNEIFTVSILLDTQSVAIDGVDILSLNYNPSLLEAQDEDFGTSGVQISAGNLLTSTLANSVDTTNGKIQFSQTSGGGTTFTGSGTLATLRFRVVGAGTATVSFDFTSGSTIDTNVASSGSDVLSTVTNGNFNVGSSGGGGGSSGGGGGGGGGGGSSGGGGAAASSGETKTITQFSPGTASSVMFTKSAVESISIEVSSQANNVAITVNEVSPPSVPLQNTYKYIDIKAADLSNANIKSANISFFVEKSWLAGKDKNSVRLNRYTDSWSELATSMDSENATAVRYTATTPGFSIFAITAQPLAEQQQPGQQPQQPTEQPQQPSREETTNIGGVEVPKAVADYGPLILIAVLIIIAVLLALPRSTDSF